MESKAAPPKTLNRKLATQKAFRWINVDKPSICKETRKFIVYIDRFKLNLE